MLRFPDGSFHKFRVRSLVGLIPLFAAERLEMDWVRPFHDFTSCLEWFLKNRHDLVQDVVHNVNRGGKETQVLTIVNKGQLTRILARLWDADEFLSPYGIRSLSKAHQRQPFEHEGATVAYEPAEAVSKIKGGNSNWRGPIWLPTCFLLIESLRKLGKAYGPDYRLDVPGGSGPPLGFREMAHDLARRLIGIFLRDATGRRPVHGRSTKFQDDPHWRDLILFYEYFDGDEGRGLGASHQTGWTSLVSPLIDEWPRLSDKASSV